MSVETKPTTEEHAQDGAWIQTYTGLEFWIDDPVFRMDDIAHALSMVCRYNGHTRHFYSVAEHSVIVSLLMQELKLGDPMEGLMHDGTEAYIQDMPRPWKKLLPDYVLLEHRLEAKLREAFYLPTAKTYGCKQADHIALFLEAWFLMPDRGKTYSDPMGVRPIALKLVEQQHWRTLNLFPSEAEAAFMKRYNELLP